MTAGPAPDSTVDRRPVVVGMDGSADARAAVDFAAWEATWRHRPVRLVYAVTPAPSWYRSTALALGNLDEPGRRARILLRDTADGLRRRDPDLEVSTDVITGDPAGVLVNESRRAALVVLGSRGTGGFGGLLAGSVGIQVATHGAGPVVVIRPPGADTGADPAGPGDVVVGVDGSTGSAAAVDFAVGEAAARGSRLVAVYAWGDVPLDNLDTDHHQDLHDAQAEAERLLAEAVAGNRGVHPDLEVRTRAVHSYNPVPTLVAESAGAALVVVGSRGRGGFARLLLGSVGDGLLRYAHRPVAIVHGGDSGGDSGAV